MLRRARCEQNYCTLAIQLAKGGRVMLFSVVVEEREASSVARVFTVVTVRPEADRSRVIVCGVAVQFIATMTAGPEPVERM